MSDTYKELLKQSNQAAIDIGFKALGSLFLLNGAAATALLAKDVVPIWPTACFALAALWSVASMGISYVFCLALAESFRGAVSWPRSLFHKVLTLSWSLCEAKDRENLLKWRIRIIIFSLAPAALFFLGLVLTIWAMG